MKHILAILLLALCVGCKSSTSQYTLVNNTPYLLKVYQDGEYKSDLQPGLIHRVRGTLFGRNTIVTVTGVDGSGVFVGSDSFTYLSGTPTVWTVSTLNSAADDPAIAAKGAAGQSLREPTLRADEDAGGAAIDGAFGLKLGDRFDTNTGVVVEPSRWGELAVGDHQVVYKFTPTKPLPPFEGYYVEITPKTHKICSIIGVVQTNLKQGTKEQLDVVVAALSQKYGKGKPGWGFVLYSADRDGRGIRLLRSVAQLSERSETRVVTLSYGERSLQELAKRERAEVLKADQDAKKSELEKKAKALDASGL